MTYKIHFDDISVEVGDSKPFVVLQDKYGHLTGRCRSTDISISVKDILVGDNVDIAGNQGLVTKIEKVEGEFRMTYHSNPTPIFVTEEEFEYLENCLMSVPTYKITDPADKIKLELLERVLDSRKGNYLYPISDVEKQTVESLLRKRKEDFE